MNDWQDAERRVEKARQFFERQQWALALEELRAAIGLNPYNNGWFFNIGLILDEMGRYDEAIEAYQQALEIDENDLQSLDHLGLDLFRTTRHEQAIKTFERVEALDPSYEPSYCHRIIAYCALGDHEKAEEMFYLARLYKDECPLCYYNMGCSLAQRGQYDRAIACWRKTLDLDHDHLEVHVRIAEALHAKGELEQSRRHYLTALRQEPGNTQTLLDLGELLVEMGRLDEAGEKFRRAIELSPETPSPHYCYGQWQLQRGHEQQAVQSMLRTLQLDPTFAGAHVSLARICLKRNEIHLARKHLRSEILLHPENRERFWKWRIC